MIRKARMWIGLTLFIVLAFNYAFIGFPLISKSLSVNSQTKSILIKQAKSNTLFKNTTDSYMLDLLRREKASIDRKLLILNCVAISFSIIIVSWVIFGLITHRR
jgi:hypothetical protein